jgi:LysR family nitrogen assimilation transcriptional regulator
VLPRSVARRMIGGTELHQRHLAPALEVQVSLGTASGQTLSRAAEAVRELLREVLRSYVSP